MVFSLNSCAYTPQQNGTTERKYHHLLELPRSIIFASHVPNSFWGEAVLTASYLINCLSSKNLQIQTPLSASLIFFLMSDSTTLCDKKFLVVPFCIYKHTPSCGKLHSKAIKCVFVGYSATQKTVKILIPILSKNCSVLWCFCFKRRQLVKTGIWIPQSLFSFLSHW